jgi:membrane-associated phospholipid phosphatase
VWGDLVTTLDTLGNPQNWIVLVIVLAIVVGLLRGLRAGLFVGATYIVDFIATLSKVYAERVRPDTAAAHLLYGTDSFGFPSGHTARAAALLGALIWVFAPTRWRLPGAVIGAVIGGFAMGYARVALGVHFPTDVLGGFLLGLAWLTFTAALL